MPPVLPLIAFWITVGLFAPRRFLFVPRVGSVPWQLVLAQEMRPGVAAYGVLPRRASAAWAGSASDVDETDELREPGLEIHAHRPAAASGSVLAID